MKSYHTNLGARLAGLLKAHPEPQPGRQQVLVRVRTVSLNYRELVIAVHGSYPLPVRTAGRSSAQSSSSCQR
jgi:NADPH:quinone reductase-like Zn-dependent oxidoreductase